MSFSRVGKPGASRCPPTGRGGNLNTVLKERSKNAKLLEKIEINFEGGKYIPKEVAFDSTRFPAVKQAGGGLDLTIRKIRKTSCGVSKGRFWRESYSVENKKRTMGEKTTKKGRPGG